jgi:hypothetical protein
MKDGMLLEEFAESMLKMRSDRSKKMRVFMRS